MGSEIPASRETQEQSIKARKRELFQPEAPPPPSSAPRKSIKEYLRDTKPMPMAPGTKGALWVAAVLVAVLFLAALITSSSRPRRRRAPRPQTELTAPPSVLIATELPIQKNRGS